MRKHIIVCAWMLALALTGAAVFPIRGMAALAADNPVVLTASTDTQAGRRTPEEILSGMTTEEKITQMLMPTFRYYTDEAGTLRSVTAVTEDIRDMLTRYGFAGIILFAQNTGETDAAVRLLDDMQKANAQPDNRTQLLMAIDQEGGRVTRLGQGTQMPGNMALGAAGDTALTERAAAIIGTELISMGIHLNMAPVLDVNSNPANPVIGTRSFSDDPETVAEQGVHFMQALQSTGAIATLKHFPGHGDTDTDSHTGLPKIEKTYAELKANELIPFQAAIDAGAEAVMTAHIQYPAIETETYVSVLTGEEIALPATLSHTILTDILRRDMGFQGVIFTDAMNMDAIARHFDRLDAARLAITAGVDVILMPVDVSTQAGMADFEQYIRDLTEMADDGSLSMEQIDSAVLRVLTLKDRHGLTEPYAGIDPEGASVVGSAAHHAAEWEITKKTVTLVKNDGKLLPLTKEGQKIVLLTAYNNEVFGMEYAVNLLRDEEKLPNGTEISVHSIQGKSLEEALTFTDGADCVIIVSELGSAAALNPSNSAGAYSAVVDGVITAVHGAGGKVILLSCFLPYDAARYPGADAVMLTWSARAMSEDPRVKEGAVAQYGPNMPAALYVMFSEEDGPAGTLPVNIPKLDENYAYTDEILYPRGYGLRYGDEADSASIHTLSRNHSGNVTAVVSFPGAAGTVWCAGYDVSGKMTGIQMKEAETGVHQYAFTFPGADTVRAFVLDENLCPLCASKSG